MNWKKIVSKNKLDSQALRLIRWAVFFRFWKVLFSVFINVYLWKETADIQLLAIYNIFVLSSHMIGFIFWSLFVRKGYAYQTSNIAFMWLTIAFLLLSLSIWSSILIYYIFGAIFWLFNGMYYSAQNVRLFSATTFKNRWHSQGLKKALDWWAKIIFPLVIWSIISIWSIQIALIIWVFMYLLGMYLSNFRDVHLKNAAPYSYF
jgi:YQGE family putative transporter